MPVLVFTSCKSDQAPNVILILTDDQGIGDLACHGNPWIKTPHLDAFYEEAVRLTDFHVSPLCTPTRAAMMTGLYPINNGAWATYKGRDALSEGAFTMADLFQQNGYSTGIFGKWYLGDNYPCRPTDCGFDVAVHHLAGGVGELSDYWGNTYFDDTYYVNNQPQAFEGYCTDVWFDQAMKFIDRQKDKPFFLYLPTNAPHDPLYVDKKYAAPYQQLEGDKIVSADYYGMIANIDENFGKFKKYLTDKGLMENTILIFMSDNGTRFGIDREETLGHNMGLRGMKGDRTEGGHRVPFFVYWKKGNIYGGKDINEVAAHVDLLPTLANLCGIESDSYRIPEDKTFDGIDLSELLLNKEEKLAARTVFIHNRQDWRPPFAVDQTCIIKDHWRLINGNELYDIEKDRKQLNDLASSQPEVVQSLLKQNTAFVNVAKENSVYHEMPSQIIGHPQQKEIKLTIQHAIGEDSGIWKSEQVAAGMKNKNNTHALSVDQTGWYQIDCRRWPKECPGPILGIPEKNPKNWFTYNTINPEKVRIRIANQLHEKIINPKDESVIFNVYLEKGKTFLTNDFIEGDKKYGVYYTYITTTEQPTDD